MDPSKNLHDNYKLEGELGSGSFATVKGAINKKTGERVAIKIISKTQLTEDDKIGL